MIHRFEETGWTYNQSHPEWPSCGKQLLCFQQFALHFEDLPSWSLTVICEGNFLPLRWQQPWSSPHSIRERHILTVGEKFSLKNHFSSRCPGGWTWCVPFPVSRLVKYCCRRAHLILFQKLMNQLWYVYCF